MIGAGENGRVIQNILSQQFDVIGYLDDRDVSHRLGTVGDYPRFLGERFFITFGNNHLRLELYQRMAKAGARFVNAIHPRAVLESDVVVGENIFIGALSYVNIGAQIGHAAFINNGCIVEHDCQIGDGAHLAPGVVMGGGVKVGLETFVGLGARINDHRTIGERVTVGSGSVVIADLPPGVTAVGVPARIKSMQP